MTVGPPPRRPRPPPPRPTPMAPPRGNAMHAAVGQFRHLPAALLTTQLQEPGSHQPDGLQPVHPAAGRIQPGRAADQHQHQSADPDHARAPARARPIATGYLGKNVTVTDGQGALTDGAASWNYNLGTASATTPALTVTNASGQTVYTGAGSTTAGQQHLQLERPGQQRQPAARRHLHADGDGDGRSGTAITTAVSQRRHGERNRHDRRHAATDDRHHGSQPLSDRRCGQQLILI